MQRNKRGTYAWLLLLGLAIGIIALAEFSGGTVLQVAAGLVLLLFYFAVATLALGQNTFERMRDQIKLPSFTAGFRASAAARRAAHRAAGHIDYNPDYGLTDVGLIFNKRQRDGSWERNLVGLDQTVSIQEAALQPFAKIMIPASLSDHVSIITFEVYDQAGQLRFTRQVEQLMRYGENTILCDRQHPLQGGDPVLRSGMWDLRILVNGNLIGIHSFGIKPSAEQRRRYFSSDGEAAVDHLKIPDNDGPVSLDELLRQQRKESSDRR